LCRSRLSQAHGSRSAAHRVEKRALGRVTRPIRRPQHFQNGRCRRGSFAAGDAVKVDGAAKLKAVDRSLLQRVGTRNAARSKRDAKIRFEQRDQIPFRAQLVSLVDVETMAANERREPFEVLERGRPKPTFLPQVIDLDRGTRSEAMLGAEDESELFGEERPAIETLPGMPEVRGDGELGAARLEKLDDFGRRPAQ